mmetsp:Transcript_17863/g.27610  ORF Transcript_17863/g.27610 Transcript_17863/m.27610 type:complete len:291 (-) Transcript_17863:21-893(-)
MWVRLPLAALLLAAQLHVCVCFSSASAMRLFQLPSPAGKLTGFRPSLRCGGFCERGSAVCGLKMGGGGFGAAKGRMKLKYGGSEGNQATQLQTWEAEYQAFLKESGKELTAMSWEGFTKNGRGAIYVNRQKKGKAKQKKGTDIKTLFVPLDKYKERAPKSDQEQQDLQQILTRVEGYDPEKEFVMVFEAAGLMGADVVKPSMCPPDIHKLINPKDYMDSMEDTPEMADRKPEEVSDGVYDYWLGGDAAKPPEDPEEYIDMSNLIQDAADHSNGVMGIELDSEDNIKPASK